MGVRDALKRIGSGFPANRPDTTSAKKKGAGELKSVDDTAGRPRGRLPAPKAYGRGVPPGYPGPFVPAILPAISGAGQSVIRGRDS